MTDDWNESFDEALTDAQSKATAEEAGIAAAEVDLAYRISIAQTQCREIFERAAKELLAHAVPPDSSYRLAKPRFIWSNPTYLDGWHLWIDGVWQIWLSVDGRAWPGREPVQFWTSDLPFIHLKPGIRPSSLPHPAKDEPWDIFENPRIDSEGEVVVIPAGGKMGDAPKYRKLQAVVIEAVTQLIAEDGAS